MTAMQNELSPSLILRVGEQKKIMDKGDKNL
jgi:hypothetical protein